MGQFRMATAATVALALGFSSVIAPASAALVGTEQLLEQSQQASAQQRVDGFMARAEVQQQLEAWGVDAQQAQARVASLSDAELQQLAEKIDELPAGAGALEVIGIVFLVLLILELVGVINVFSRI